MQPLFGQANQLCNLCRGHHEEQFCKIILNMKWIRRCCLNIKDNSYLELWRPFCSAEQNHKCNFGRGHHDHEEQFCAIILNLNPQLRGCCFTIFITWSSGSSFILCSRNIPAILVEGIMRNNSIKLICIWISGQYLGISFSTT